jgi:glycosyltransferase involved in cell wall biosynthesis
MTPSTSLIIPAFNESEGLPQVLRDLSQTDIPGLLEILIVDDGSGDDTGRVAESYGDQLPVRVIRHPVNRGYGASLKTGIRAAQGDVVVTMDADGQHTPEDAVRVIAALEAGRDMAVGLRDSTSARDAWRQPGKWVLGKLANYLSRTRIPDLNSGLRAIRRDVILKYLHLLPGLLLFFFGIVADQISALRLEKYE